MKTDNGQRDERTIPLPLAPHVWGAIRLPLPLSGDEWAELLAILAAFRPALVVPSAPEPAGEEATDDR